MVELSFILTDDAGREHRFDRYAHSASLMDSMLAEDSAIRAFVKIFGLTPASVRRVK